MARFALILCVILVLATSSFLNAAAFFGLGDLPGGDFKSNVRGISADGRVVVGRSESYAGQSTAFLWTRDEGMISLGQLDDSGNSSALGVSDDGLVVVGVAVVVGDGGVQRKAFIWTEENGMTTIGSRRELLTFDLELARAVSFDGSVVTGFSNSEIGKEAFVWTEADGVVPLGQFTGVVPDTVGRGVSADGSTVLVSSDTPGGLGVEYNSFLWRKGEDNEFLPNPGGDVFGVVGKALSPDGSTVVGQLYSSVEGRGYRTPFRWTAESGVVELDLLRGSQCCDSPNAVSGDGSIIVGQSSVNGRPIAVMWDDLGVRSIQSVMYNKLRMRELLDWELQSAFAVSDDGLSIVGSGINPDGNEEAWMAIIPESSSDILAMFGFLGVLGFVTMRRLTSKRQLLKKV